MTDKPDYLAIQKPEGYAPEYLSVPDESLSVLADEAERTGKPVRNERIAAFMLACGLDPTDTRRGADVAREMVRWFRTRGMN